MISYYNYSKLGYYTKDYRSRNIVRKVQLDVLEIILLGKQSLSNSDINNK